MPRAALPARLAHLDGMRAAASLYVVVFHAVFGFQRGELAGPFRVLKRLAAFGHEAVAVFIVLSGYCLMLPVVRAGAKRLPRTFASFIARRALRILPPYYASVALSLALIACVDVLGRPGSGTTWDESLPAIGLGPIGSHLLLVHNWFPDWAFRINGPFWSVATEWQIYFFFPLLLLPLWRKSGLGASVLIALALGFSPLFFYPAGAKTAIPWYLGLFAFGVGAAAIVDARDGVERTLRARVPFGALTLCLWGLALVGGWGFGTLWFRHKALTDVLIGLATATFLVHTSLGIEAGTAGRVTRWLGSRPAVALGHMSYSLYLTHLPVLALCHFALLRWELTPGAHTLALLALGSAASLVAARAFYLGVERYCVAPFPAPVRRVLSLGE